MSNASSSPVVLLQQQLSSLPRWTPQRTCAWPLLPGAAPHRAVCISSVPPAALRRVASHRTPQVVGTLASARRQRLLQPLGATQTADVSTAPPAGQSLVAEETGPAAAAVQGQPEIATFVLDVGGMKCGGCSAAVKRMLAQQDYVLTSGVNLVTNSAAVGVQDGPGAAELAERAAEALTSKGFPSRVRQPEDDGIGMPGAEEAAGSSQLSMLNLAFAWGLVAFCCLHHAGHLLHDLGMHSVAHLPLLHAMGNPWVSGVLGGAALLGPGRELIRDGAAALWRGAPNMNSLIGLGAATSFAIGSASFVVPGLAWDPSFVEEPVMLLAFVLLGRTLEARARAKASADLRSLALLIPAQSRLVLDPGSAPGAAQAAAGANGSAAAPVDVVMVPTKTVRAGDLVRVLPGERFPVDGQLLDGYACGADESMLTGESLPVAKKEGDAVCAGTVCYEGAVTLKATSTGKDSRLAGIGRLVADAQAREAPVQRLADAVAGKFCYSVMGASAATFAFWSLAGGRLFPWVMDSVPGLGDAASGMEYGGGAAALLLATKLAVDVLVVACPCALGLATPTAVVVASSVGAKRGLLLRGGDVIEALARVDTVVLDKTGTLTQGRMRVQHVHAWPGPAGVSEDEVLRLAAAVEAHTRHPVADAVLAACEGRGIQAPPAERCSTVPGEGVSGIIDGRLVAVGKLDWVRMQVGGRGIGGDDMASSLPLSPLSGGGGGYGNGLAASGGLRLEGTLEAEAQAGAQTVVYIGRQGDGLLGACGLADELRPEAKAVVASLRQRGLRVLLMSGDNAGAVEAAAAAAGVPTSDAAAGLRPEDKVARVRTLREAGAVVAMVGDGVNDAPALAGADVGVAVHGGMEAAGEAADVVLMGESLEQLVQAIDLGRATLSKIRANLTWALFYNLGGIPLAAGVLLPAYGIALSPSVAGGLMAFSSVAVVSNSLLLRAQLSGKGQQQQQLQQPAATASVGSGQ